MNGYTFGVWGGGRWRRGCGGNSAIFIFASLLNADQLLQEQIFSIMSRPPFESILLLRDAQFLLNGGDTVDTIQKLYLVIEIRSVCISVNN